VDIEVLGLLFYKDSSETTQTAGGSPFEVETVRRMAQIFDDNDYDRVLILQNSFAADPIPIASFAAAITKKLAFMIAHRPGFIAPTMAARMLATIDHLSHGRAGVHIISAANDVETQCDGDFLTKEVRYRRSGEYVDVLRQVWGAQDPVTFEGEFYRFNRALSELRPYDKSIPVYWGGSSPQSMEYSGRYADVHAMSGVQPLAEMRKFADAIRASAAKAGRTIRLQCSVKMIVGDTEEAAWKQADAVVEGLRQTAERQEAMRQSGKTAVVPGMRIDNSLTTSKGGHGVNRRMSFADAGDVLDKRLWTGATRASQTFSTPMLPPVLVGTPEQVVDAIGDYYDMGITGFLTSGFDASTDAPLFGQEIIPLLRKMARERAPRHVPAELLVPTPG
jgi:alkanesulfonate monooxygenase